VVGTNCLNLTRVRCASALSNAIPSCKTNDEGVGDYDIDEGPVHEVELRGDFLVASFSHLQQ
jgi:hypothetical protein